MESRWSRILYRCGLVRLKHYESLVGRYARLAEKYTEARNLADHQLAAYERGDCPDEYTIEVEFDSLLPEARTKRKDNENVS